MIRNPYMPCNQYKEDKTPKPSENCYRLIRHFEGCKLEAYLCSAKRATIGWGNTQYPDGRQVRLGDKITQKQADEMLPLIVTKFAQAVDKALLIYPTQNEFDALTSLVYNIGIGSFEKSTLLQKINKNAPIEEIKHEFLRWNRAGGKVLNGLVKRRAAEFSLFSSGELNL